VANAALLFYISYLSDSRIVRFMLNLHFSADAGSALFLFAQKGAPKMLSRAPTVLLIITPLSPTHINFTTRNKTQNLSLIFSCLTAALIAYGDISIAIFFFGYALRVLLYFRLYCSFAKEVLLKFSI